jgi:hypothetical protein
LPAYAKECEDFVKTRAPKTVDATKIDPAPKKHKTIGEASGSDDPSGSSSSSGLSSALAQMLAAAKAAKE